MTQKNLSDIAASIHQRLLNIIQKTGDNPNYVWTRYAMERFLYRLASSKYVNDFILKGAGLFMVWTGQAYRPTVDIDFLGRCSNSNKCLKKIFQEICRVRVEPDGLEFDKNSIKVNSILESQEYQGMRASLTAFLSKARIPIQIDVGFGDVVTPKAKKLSYPTLLNLHTPIILAYPRETVIAEKLQILVKLSIANSRMKDFYDLYILSRDFSFEGNTLIRAIKATFKRRKTNIPVELPMALTDAFCQNKTKSLQWKAFVMKNELEKETPELSKILLHLRKFLSLPMRIANGRESASITWIEGGPWK